MRQSVLAPVVLLLLGIGESGAQCPSGWTGFQTSCYKIITNGETWLGSNGVCELNGGYLAELTTQDEVDFATQQVANNTLRAEVWIGLSDIQDEGLWMWTQTRMEATVFDWAPKQPSTKPDEEAVQDCVLIATDSHWHDFPCNKLSYFMCEKSGTNPVIG